MSTYQTRRKKELAIFMPKNRCPRPNGENKEQGFTLVELLVVILIIGILSAIAIPAFMNQRKEAADAALKGDMRSVAIAMETWKVKGNLASNVKPKAGQGGWTVVKRSDETSIFAGDYTAYHSGAALVPQIAPDGLEDIEVSEGVGIGIVTNNYNTGGSGYCIVGSVKGGHYDATKKVEPGVSAYTKSLYYDSRGGGLFTPDSIPDDSSCSHYGNRIKNGI